MGFSVYVVQAIQNMKTAKNMDMKESIEGPIAKYIAGGMDLAMGRSLDEVVAKVFRLLTELAKCGGVIIYIPDPDEVGVVLRYDCVHEGGHDIVLSRTPCIRGASMVSHALAYNAVYNLHIDDVTVNQHGWVATSNAEVANGRERLWLQSTQHYLLGNHEDSPEVPHTELQEHADFPSEPFASSPWRNTLIVPVQTSRGSIAIQLVNKNEIPGGKNKPPSYPDFTVQDEELLVVMGHPIASLLFQHLMDRESTKVDTSLSRLHSLTARIDKTTQTFPGEEFLKRLNYLLDSDLVAVWRSDHRDHSDQQSLQRIDGAQNTRNQEQKSLENQIHETAKAAFSDLLVAHGELFRLVCELKSMIPPMEEEALQVEKVSKSLGELMAELTEASREEEEDTVAGYRDHAPRLEAITGSIAERIAKASALPPPHEEAAEEIKELYVKKEKYGSKRQNPKLGQASNLNLGLDCFGRNSIPLSLLVYRRMVCVGSRRVS